jgi:hypothetical protein
MDKIKSFLSVKKDLAEDFWQDDNSSFSAARFDALHMTDLFLLSQGLFKRNTEHH